nr:MAG TPA: hypothetical protein [Caudoviricetes sp.]
MRTGQNGITQYSKKHYTTRFCFCLPQIKYRTSGINAITR